METSTEHRETLELEPVFVDLENKEKREAEVDDYLTEDPLNCSPKTMNDIVYHVDAEKGQQIDVKTEPLGRYGDFDDVRHQASECKTDKVHSDTAETSAVEDPLRSVGDTQASCQFTFVKVEEAECNLEDVSNTLFSNQQKTPVECVSRNRESEIAQIILNHDISNCKNNFDEQNLMAEINNVKHKIVNTEKSFDCSYCPYKTNKCSRLTEHMRTHTNEKPFGCNQCSYKSAHKKSLVNHIRTHTNEKPFACNLCSFRATQRCNLVRHMSTHTNEKPFACNQCSYRAAQYNTLVTHIRTHTNEKPFSCIQCSYRATTRSALVVHLRNHTDDKPFVCSQCDFRTTHNGNLVKHMATHTDEKPFACNKCSYKASWRSYLVSHMRIHK